MQDFTSPLDTHQTISSTTPATMPRAATPDHSSGTMTDEKPVAIAAAKVFSIPELVEHILLSVAALALASAHTTPWPATQLEPTTTIGRIRAVDRTCRNTIDGSKKLQALMRHANGLTTKNDTQRALCWLTRKLFGRFAVFDGRQKYELHQQEPWRKDAERPRVDGSWAIAEHYRALSDRERGEKEPAWRQVKLAILPTEKKGIWVVHFPFRFDARRSEGCDIVCWEPRHYRPETTLGEIFDEFTYYASWQLWQLNNPCSDMMVGRNKWTCSPWTACSMYFAYLCGEESVDRSDRAVEELEEGGVEEVEKEWEGRVIMGGPRGPYFSSAVDSRHEIISFRVEGEGPE